MPHEPLVGSDPMEMPEPEEPLHSPLRYVTSGIGCGCGCLGMLVVLASSVALVAIPLEMYSEGPGNAGMLGVLGAITGLLICGTGLAAYVGSLFMD